MAKKRKYTRRSNGNSNGNSNGARRSNGNSNGAPPGFVKVEGAQIAGFWIPEIAGQALRGTVGEFVTKMGVDQKPNTYCHLTLTSDDVSGPVIGQDRDTKRKHKVDAGSGMIVGVGGAVLLSRLRGREGREVHIVFCGLGDKVKGKNQARLYDVYERER